MADNDVAAGAPPEMRLELIPVPVSDVGRAKAFMVAAIAPFGRQERGSPC